MRIALAQVNPTIGDLRRNTAIVEHAVANAKQCGVDLLVFPELSLVGYPPRDLLLQEGFIAAAVREADRIGREHTRETALTIVLGLPMPVSEAELNPPQHPIPGGITNSLLVYQHGARTARYDKQLLPTYDVFDEDRYFTEGRTPVVIEVASQISASCGTGVPPVQAAVYRVGLTICEDLWRGEDVGFAHHYAHHSDPVADLAKLDGGRGVDLIINPSASPFVLGKGKRHRELLARHARTHRLFVAAVNQVGGNDELVFDGSAAVFDPLGRLVAAGRAFAEDLVIVDLPTRDAALAAPAVPAPVHDPLVHTSDESQLFSALVLGVRDYCRKTGFKDVVLGLSGGIDSAVTAVIAAAALGSDHVLAASMPSRYSSQGSKDDALDLAQRLGVRCVTLPIEDAFTAYERTLREHFTGRGEGADVTEENIQSRVRGTLLMALSNKFGSLLLTTGNKSELAVGYCTLYGDMNGGLAVLSDVSKQWVYRLANWINEHHASLQPRLAQPPIPESTITKPPSAELRPDQKDQDTLPPYDVLDEIIRRHVELRQSAETIVRETGFDAQTVRRMTRLIDRSEFKRKQAATGLKVTGVAFGSGRRWPIAQGWQGA